MNNRISASLAAPFLLLLVVSGASAQVQRTFVSGLGNDGNPCNRTAPCRTFGTAIGQTTAGGEVYVLDTAGYGPFSIAKSITINAPQGVIAGISVFSGDGIDINIQIADTVILRGLTVNSQGSLGNGIAFHSHGTVHVESCVVNGFNAGDGIVCDGGGILKVKDSITRGNDEGILISGASAGAVDQVRMEGNADAGLEAILSKVTVRNSVALNNTNGFLAMSGGEVTVQNSVAASNAVGFFAISTVNQPADLNIESCVASNNTGVGIQTLSTASAIATVRVSNSTVTDNNIGLANDGSPAVLLSRGNNTVEGNTTNTLGTIGSYSAK